MRLRESRNSVSTCNLVTETELQLLLFIGVCVFLTSGYEWVTVMHEIPISSAQSMTSYFHTLGLSSTAPLVPLAVAVTHEKVPTSP